jgi:hypothetical protein
MYATCPKTNQAVLIKSFRKQKKTFLSLSLFSIVLQIPSLSQQTPPNFIALSFQSSLFSIVFCGSLFLGLFTAKVVSQSIYNGLFAANVQSFSVHGLFAAKVYTTWFVHRSSSSHDATVARSLHGGSPSFSPFLRFQFYEGLGFGCNNQFSSICND